MKKETVVAIVLGIIAGISIAGFVIFNSRKALQNESDVILEDISPTKTINTDEISPLLIKTPEDESVVESDTITIDGSSQEGALIIVQSPLGEQSIDHEGSEFSADVDLMPGENMIRITAYNEKNIDSRTLTIYSIPKE